MTAPGRSDTSARTSTHLLPWAKIKALEQLQHNDRLSTVGEVSAGIAHELGTPLNIVSGRANMICREDLSLDEIRENAEIIRNQSERMTKTIRQLLDFSRREKLRFAITNINSLIIQVFDILSPIAKKQNVSLLIDISFLAESKVIKEITTRDFELGIFNNDYRII